MTAQRTRTPSITLIWIGFGALALAVVLHS